MDFDILAVKSPSFSQDRRGWNAAWELELGVGYGSGVEISCSIPLHLQPSLGALGTGFYEAALSDTCVAGIQRLKGHICDLQRDLTHAAVPEITLARMNHESGNGFIKLMKQLCHPELLSDPNPYASPEDYKTVPNAVYDRMMTFTNPKPHPGAVLMKRMLEGRRTYFLTMVVYHTLGAFYGEAKPVGGAKPPRNDSDPDAMRRLRPFLPPGIDAKVIIKNHEVERKDGERHCLVLKRSGRARDAKASGDRFSIAAKIAKR
ncbi:hypothetical protein C8R46DRAFT_1034564 [Mycena filopes]|nr:hypothetical protein C8R46DRAFT_1034564 [Mycena filopes]